MRGYHDALLILAIACTAGDRVTDACPVASVSFATFSPRGSKKRDRHGANRGPGKKNGREGKRTIRREIANYRDNE